MKPTIHSLLRNEPPIIPVYTETGGLGGAYLDVGMDDYRNPVKDLILGKDNVNKFLKVIGDTLCRFDDYRRFEPREHHSV